MGNSQEREGDGGGLGVVDWIGLAGTGTVDHLVSFRLVSWIPNGRLTPFTGPAGGDDLIKALMCVWVRPNLAFPNSSEKERRSAQVRGHVYHCNPKRSGRFPFVLSAPSTIALGCTISHWQVTGCPSHPARRDGNQIKRCVLRMVLLDRVLGEA